jgi:hypothetical protein
VSNAFPLAAAAAATPVLLRYCGLLTSPARLPPAVRTALARRTLNR